MRMFAPCLLVDMRLGIFENKKTDFYAVRSTRESGTDAMELKLFCTLFHDDNFLVGAFRRKTQTIVVTFFKTNELTDFINFVSWH